MEIRHLKLIKTIVEEGSIANAIGKLHLTPSALSHQLKEAELQLGTRIFHRVNKKLILTDAGQKVYDSSRVILAELDKVNQEIRSMVAGESGLIRLSTECYTSYFWLPSVLKKFRTEFSGVEVKVVFEATHHPIQKLMQGVIDLAITSDPGVTDTVEYVELFHDEMVAVVSESHAWATKEFVSAHDFETENLFIHSEPLETVTVYQKVLQPAGVKPRNLTILPLTEACVEMIKAEMGVMVMARWALQPYLHSNAIRTVRVTQAGLHRTQYAARLANTMYPEYFEYFIKFLKEAIEL